MSQDQEVYHKKNSNISKLLVALGGVAVISFFGGTILMLIDMTINNAYPNLHATKPGISFMDSARLFFLLVIFFTIFQAIKATQKKS
jgi:hypothetical protein